MSDTAGNLTIRPIQLAGFVLTVAAAVATVIAFNNSQWDAQRQRDDQRAVDQRTRDSDQDAAISALRDDMRDEATIASRQLNGLTRDISDLRADLARMGADISRQIEEAGRDRWKGQQEYGVMNELQRRNPILDVPDPRDETFRRSLKPVPFGPPPDRQP